MQGTTIALRNQKRVQEYVYVAPTVLFIILIVIFPLIYSLVVSFTDTRLGRPSSFIGLGNYGEALLSDHRFWSSLAITFKIGAPALILEFAIGMLLAVLLNRNIRGRVVFLSFLSLPVMIAPAVAGLTWRMLYAPKYGAVNGILRSLGFEANIAWLAKAELAIPAIIAVDVWQTTPFVMLVLLAGLQAISPQIEEAARVDGATPWQIFKSINLPLIKKAVAAIFLLRLIDIVKLFDMVWCITQGGPGGAAETISLYIYINGFKYLRIGYASALSYLLLIGVILLTVFLLRSLFREAA